MTYMAIVKNSSLNLSFTLGKDEKKLNIIYIKKTS